MFDIPDTTGAAASAEAEPGTGQEDPSPPAEQQDAAAEEDAAWDEVIAAEKGEDPPAPKGESGDEDPEEPAGEAGAEGEEPEEPAAAAGAEGGEPAKGEEGAEAAAGAAADADPGSEAEVDWGQVDPKAKAAYDAAMSRAAKAEHAFKSREGREAALQRKLDAVIAGDEGGEKKPAAGEQPADQPSAESKAAAEEFQKEWKDFASNYPEIAEPIGKVIGFQNQRIAALSEEGVALRQENERLKIGMQQVGEDRQAAAAEVAEQLVQEAHPDVDDIAGTDDFKAWVETQPDSIQAIATANAEQLVDAPGVNRLLDLYKLDQGITTNGRRNGASTAEPEPGAAAKAAAEPEPGAQKPAASARREIQRRSASAPAPSPGAPAREDDPTLGETEDDVWAEILTADKRQKRAAEARA